MAYQIDASRCTRCYVCIYKCPAKVISTDSGYSPPIIDTAQCINCGECAAACRPQAIVNR